MSPSPGEAKTQIRRWPPDSPSSLANSAPFPLDPGLRHKRVRAVARGNFARQITGGLTKEVLPATPLREMRGAQSPQREVDSESQISAARECTCAPLSAVGREYPSPLVVFL